MPYVKVCVAAFSFRRSMFLILVQEYGIFVQIREGSSLDCYSRIKGHLQLRSAFATYVEKYYCKMRRSFRIPSDFSYTVWFFVLLWYEFISIVNLRGLNLDAYYRCIIVSSKYSSAMIIHHSRTVLPLRRGGRMVNKSLPPSPYALGTHISPSPYFIDL